jgi:hypothetical protein
LEVLKEADDLIEQAVLLMPKDAHLNRSDTKGLPPFTVYSLKPGQKEAGPVNRILTSADRMNLFPVYLGLSDILGREARNQILASVLGRVDALQNRDTKKMAIAALLLLAYEFARLARQAPDKLKKLKSGELLLDDFLEDRHLGFLKGALQSVDGELSFVTDFIQAFAAEEAVEKAA